MNLSENISRVQSLMGLNESSFLKRRVTPKQLDDSFNESLSYWISHTKERMRRGDDRPANFGNMIHAVISMTIDEIHPELIADRKDFPYDQVFNSLTEKYMDQMEDAYNHNFPPL